MYARITARNEGKGVCKNSRNKLNKNVSQNKEEQTRKEGIQEK